MTILHTAPQTPMPATDMPSRQRPFATLIFRLMDGLTGACLGATFYGSWGVYANSAHGWNVALRSGLAQGAMSFVVTLFGVTLMKWLFQRVLIHMRPWWRTPACVIAALAIIYGGIVGVHLFLGTPEIILTLLPGLPITIGFCCVFVGTMFRLETAAANLPSDSREL